MRGFVAALMLALLAPGAAASQVGWPSFQPFLTPEFSASPVAAALPVDLHVADPPPGLAPARAGLAGRWVGWGGRDRAVDIAFAVESFGDDGAGIALAVADGSGAIAFRGQARFVGDELYARIDDGRRVAFRLRPDGHVDFMLVGANETRDPPDKVSWVAGLLWRGLKGSRETVMLPTDLVEGGAQVRLETKIVRPEGSGPFPLLIFHHGSTGRGTDPRAFRNPIDSGSIAIAFGTRGWMVAFPARRGRAGSDGRYDEGFALDRRQGYTCEAPLALAGLERALADAKAATDALRRRSDVDPTRTLIGGQSRGGILAVAYAGAWPADTRGVINFVGGWLGEGCGNSVSQQIFGRGKGFGTDMLWLYGERDSFYSIAHSRGNFEAFVAAGGHARFEVFDLGEGRNGHFLVSRPELWTPAVADYLRRIGLD